MARRESGGGLSALSAFREGTAGWQTRNFRSQSSKKQIPRPRPKYGRAPSPKRAEPACFGDAGVRMTIGALGEEHCFGIAVREEQSREKRP